MTIHEIDNSAGDLRKVVLWQYDKAYRLLTVLHMMKTYYEGAIASFWSNWIYDVLNIDTCNDFGASVWGLVLGVKRLEVSEDIVGETIKRPINLETYRSLLKASFCLLKSSCSISDILGGNDDGISSIRGYIGILFTPLSAYAAAVPYEENAAISEGAIIEKDGRYFYCKESIAADSNTGWEAVVASMSVFCGVTLRDNLDMSITYEKTEFYDYMDYDQRALFEECHEEVMPYPLGIRYNNRLGKVYFGVRGQRNKNWQVYTPYTDIRKKDLVLVEEDDGTNGYYCWKSISDEDNTDIEAAKQCLVKLDSGKIVQYGAGIEISRDYIYRNNSILYYPTSEFTPEENIGWGAVESGMEQIWYWDGGRLIATGSASIEKADEYQPNIAYAAGDVVKHDGFYYYCNSSITQSFNSAWEEVASRFVPCWRDVVFSPTPTPFA